MTSFNSLPTAFSLTYPLVDSGLVRTLPAATKELLDLLR